MIELKYGPVGDPNSTDSFEWAQARMPEGWHVEGQVLQLQGSAYRYQYVAGWEATATTKLEGRGPALSAIGYTVDLALANLVRIVREKDTKDHQP